MLDTWRKCCMVVALGDAANTLPWRWTFPPASIAKTLMDSVFVYFRQEHPSLLFHSPSFHTLVILNYLILFPNFIGHLFMNNIQENPSQSLSENANFFWQAANVQLPN